jgi:Domain of unknown function (DUF4266)
MSLLPAPLRHSPALMGPLMRPLLRPLMRLARRAAALGLCAAALTGCGTLGVQPWERDLLAQPGMALSTSPLESAIDDHTYFSKEAATGGRGFGGGGCGCN